MISSLSLGACQLDMVINALKSESEEFKVTQDSGAITDLNKTNYHVSGRCPVASSTVQFSSSPTTLTCNNGLFDGYLDLSSASEGLNTVLLTADNATVDTINWNVLKDTAPPIVFVGNPVTSFTGLNKSLSFPVTFTDAAAINWTASDVTITGTGVNNCSVALSGSGLTARTITLSNCDQPSGNLTINVKASVAVDAAGNLSAISNSTASVTVDNVAPTIAETLTSQAAGNSTTSFAWQIDFTGADAMALTASDIVLSGAGAGCTKSLSGTGLSQRVLTVTGCTGNGVLNLQVPAGAATDLANNPSPALTLTTVTIDNQGPTLALGAPTPTLGNSGTTFNWTATYSGATAITLANSDVVLTGATTNCAVSVSGTGLSTRTIQVSGCTDTGTVQIQVNAGTASDAAGNLAAGSALSTAVTVNNGAVGISLSAATPAAINAAGSAQYTITYTNAVNYTLTTADISLSGTTTACTKALSGSGPTFTVTIASCSGNGNVQISVAANSANDGAGNNAPAAGPSANLVVDNLKPTIAVVGPTPTTGNSATDFTWTLNFTGASTVTLADTNVTLSGATAGCIKSITGTGLSQRVIHVMGCTGTGSLDASIPAGVLADSAGNLSDTNASLGPVTLDNTVPTLAIGAPSPTTGNNTTTFIWPVTYTGADAVNLTNADVALTTALTGCTVSVSGTGTTTRNVSVTNCAGEGTLKITINAGTASDTAGNLAAASAISTQVIVDNTAPTIAFNTPAPSNGNSATTFTWVLDFTGADVVTMANSDVYFNGATAGCAASISGTGIAQRTVSVTGCTGAGTLAIYIKAGAISDNAGNGNALTTTSPTVSISNGPPAIQVSGFLVGHDAGNSMTTVTSGSSLVNYVYKIGPTSTTDCSVTTGFSSAQALGSVTHDLTGFSAVVMTACFKGQDSFGNWSNIVDHRWSRALSAAFAGRTNICGNPVAVTSTLSTTDVKGVLTDSGGESADYVNFNENCTYTIDTGAPINLNIESFNTEANWDWLTIYDGTTAGTQLARISGNVAASYTANSGKMTLVWTSDTSQSAPGFVVSWGGVSLTGDDLDPDDFTLANILNGTTKTVYTKTFTVNGISGSAVLAGITGFDGQIKNDTQATAWATWAPVANGDSLSVRMTSGATTADNRTAVVQVGKLQKSWKLYWDITAPTGTIQIDGGAANSTTTSTTLNLTATDAESSPLQMYITQTAACSADGAWEAFSATKAWTLLNDGVVNTVYVKFRDEAGNESPCYSDSINQDNLQAPVATLTSSYGNNIATMVVDLTITFNESVTGLSISDFTLVNATMSALSGSGKVYTATITASTAGTFSAFLPANTVLDLQSNNNTASNTITWTFDNTPPVFQIYSEFPTVSKTFALYVESDDLSIPALSASVITAVNTSAINYVSSTNVAGPLRRHMFYVLPNGAGNMTFKINAGAVADAAGNTNADSNTSAVSYLKQATVTFAVSNTLVANSNSSQSVSLSISTPLARSMEIRVVRSLGLSGTAGIVDDLADSTTLTIPANATSFNLNYNTLANLGVGHQRAQLLLVSDDPAIQIGAQDTHTILFVDSTRLATTPLAQLSDDQGILTLNASGKLYGVGVGNFGTGTSLSANQNLTPTAIDAATTYKSLAGAFGSACGITSADELRCLGNWTTSDSNANFLPPTTYDSGFTYKSVSVYDGSVCGITSADKIRCRGRNSGNVFLTGTTTFKDAFVDVDTTKTYKSVLLNGQNMCAIDMSNNLYCWGENTYGAVGNGTTTAVTTPTLIDSGTTYAKLYGSGESTCGITTTGALKCWGSNSNSSLGMGDYSATRPTPGTVDAGTSYKSLVMRINNARCALTTTNIVKCWMNVNPIASPALKGYSNQSTPVVMYNSAPYEEIFGSGDGLCLRDSNNIASCANQADQGIAFRTWQTFNLTNNWTKWLPNSYYSCGLTPTGVIKCSTGLNIALGDNQTDTISRSTLVPVYSTDTFVDFDFDSTACAVTATGEVHCWGTTFGFNWTNLGSGYVFTPMRIRHAPSGAKAIAVGGSNLCVIDGSNDIRCAGASAKLLGDSTATGGEVSTFTSFIKAATTKKFNSISMSSNIVCGISTASELVCWGDYPGNGTASSLDPVVIDVGTTYQSVSMTDSARCALTVAGNLKCWGYNNGTLGLPTVTNTYVTSPTASDAGTTYKKAQVFKSSSRACGITSTDKLRCWGSVGTSLAAQATDIDAAVDYTAIYGGDGAVCGKTVGGVLKCLTAESTNDDSFYEALGTGQTRRGLAPVRGTH